MKPFGAGLGCATPATWDWGVRGCEGDFWRGLPGLKNLFPVVARAA
ncbi:MAG: hypothetical protein NTW03_11875 [Verrucomicrobia bacterium]|nr:hypothetical protein [Verrucomicrobiota bacterium]